MQFYLTCRQEKWRIVVCACCLVLFSCSRSKFEDSENAIWTEKTSYSPIELDVLEMINLERMNEGLQELQIIDEASMQAKLHNEHMILEAKVCHHFFGYRYKSLAKEAGALAVSENVAYGYGTAEAVVKAWMKSKAHKKNILGDHTHSGISIEEDRAGKLYFTNIFIRK